MPAPGSLILITGAARSGKSRLAKNLAGSVSDQVYYVATCMPQDDEMAARVARHQQDRSTGWLTIEEPMDPVRVLEDHDGPNRVFIMDCLTMLVTNLMLADAARTEKEILEAMEVLAHAGKQSQATVILVTNEVGWGIVPGDPLSRQFQDTMGRVNQVMARWADQVYLCVSGLSLEIKSQAIIEQ